MTRDIEIQAVKLARAAIEVEAQWFHSADIPSSGAHAVLQRSYGDILLWRHPDNPQLDSMEVKGEAEDKYQNFFFETWSNLVFNREYRRPGWMVTSSPTILAYCFVAEQVAYLMNFEALFHWFWGDGKRTGAVWQYGPKNEVVQYKHSQRNRTVGVPIPIKHVGEQVGWRKYIIDHTVHNGLFMRLDEEMNGPGARLVA